MQKFISLIKKSTAVKLLIVPLGILSVFYLAVNLTNTKNISPEMSIQSVSPFGKGKAIAASCGFSLHGSPDETPVSCKGICPNKTIANGQSQCGGNCDVSQTCLCPNGATNPPTCDRCILGQQFVNKICEPNCTNGANNPPFCDRCANGATNPPSCDVCTNGLPPVGGQCRNDGDPCTIVNVCGQNKTGVYKNGICLSANGESLNNSCIVTFNVTPTSVRPDGSVEFSWALENLPRNVGSRCGFVDLTTATPRPIPGLQNLDPTKDNVRISNIQSTTRFCLICQFYNLLNNASLGNAASHQWIRVIRIGEN